MASPSRRRRALRIAFRLGAACALISALDACVSLQRAQEAVLGADTAPDSGFLKRQEELAPHRDRAPFDRAWFSPQREWREYPKLYISRVDTGYELPRSGWDRANLRERKVDHVDFERLADELHAKLVAAFRADPQHQFRVIATPEEIDAETAVLQVALVQVVPNKAILGAIGLAAWGAPLEVGIPLATLTAFVAQGSVSMEARVTDAGTGRVIAMFADREAGKVRVIDLRSMTWYGHVHQTFNEWSGSLVELADTPPSHRVSHPAYFSILPW
jgi:hypothetical protein